MRTTKEKGTVPFIYFIGVAQGCWAFAMARQMVGDAGAEDAAADDDDVATHGFNRGPGNPTSSTGNRYRG